MYLNYTPNWVNLGDSLVDIYTFFAQNLLKV